ncbi:MAG: transcriptional regulator [Desulfamplus sp.]|nr:transcriptional regulator [Desulfamplus sp.]
MKPATLLINRLKVTITKDPFGPYIAKFKSLEGQLSHLAKKAGTENKKFNQALNSIIDAVRKNKDLEAELNSPIKIRALAVSLDTSCADQISLTQRILNKIDQLRPTPSTLLIQSIFQYYLQQYDRLHDPAAVSKWLIKSLPKRNLKKHFHDSLLSLNGAKWLANEAIRNGLDFRDMVMHLALDRYISGRFMTIAKNIYFIEQLEKIPLNQPHNLLTEAQKPSVYESIYDQSSLVGHKILKILIRRAANTKIDDSWLDVILSIAGDPRVPKNHPLFQKWWNMLDHKYHALVVGWLSKLDLRLFLEALKNYSNLSGKDDLKRMFPSRKKFLEGLDDKKLISRTRLYLSKSAERYLKNNYKPEHLPSYSIVSDGSISLIYVQLINNQAHMIEGSHSCYLWIYKRLHSSAIVFDPVNDLVSYNDLTSGMNQEMAEKKCEAVAQIKHSPSNFRWQKNALEALQNLGVDISAQDVLSQKDYRSFKRLFGVM